MFATRSIVHALILDPVGLRYGSPTPATSRLDPQVQDPRVSYQFVSYIRYIYRKFTHLPATETKLGNWSVIDKTLQFQRKVVVRSVTTSVSKLTDCSKTGQILAHKYNRFRPLVSLNFKTGKKLVNHACPPFITSHTYNRIVVHPSYQVVQRVVQQSAQRVVETPLIEDLLDPNRPRNGLIDGRPALQVVVVQD